MPFENFLQKIFIDKNREKEFVLGQSEPLSEEDLRFYNEATQPFNVNKLIDSRTLSGEKNKKLFEVVREVENELSSFPAFVGIAPFGSQTKGYSNEGSDFDLIILGDKKNSADYSNFLRAIERLSYELKEEGRNISLHPQTLFPDDETLFSMRVFSGRALEKREFGEKSTFSEDEEKILSEAVVLAHVITGKLIEKYRNRIKKELERLTDEKRENFFSRLIDYLAYLDEKSIPKMEERVSETGSTTSFDRDLWLSSRKNLWTKRVHKIFGD